MEQKTFIIPEALIIRFDDEDIIVTSGEGWNFGLDDDDWYDGTNA